MLGLFTGALVAATAFAAGLLTARRRAAPASAAPAAPVAPGRPTLRDGAAAAAPARLPERAEIAEGIARGEFGYHVQPIRDVSDDRADPLGRVVGVEALSRWTRADGSVLGPDLFMTAIHRGYAEGLKPPMDHTAATAAPFAAAGLFCAFNVSSGFLDRGDEAGWIDALLAPLDPAQVVFEITEGSIISHPAATARLVDALRERGVRFALDDFGTGLSNLERLQTYPVDFVKLDRRFVSALDGAEGARASAILSGLAAMRAELGFEVIAEGVETEAERDRLRGAGVTWMQGYLLGRPAPVERWAPQAG